MSMKDSAANVGWENVVVKVMVKERKSGVRVAGRESGTSNGSVPPHCCDME
jgi:hypothetical protein